ncbi:MAG: 50S ribosomal protein L11 methyltransferase [Archangium sp.]|nr:50S ribosomal protein L11 methyltransferase [Archangium sp.]
MRRLHNGRVHELVRQVTKVGVASLVPELVLRLAPEPIAPWEATERKAGSIQGPPFWAHAWPGGLALARLVLDGPGLVKGKRVLDFASGCGVSAIAAVKAGASEVFATELDVFAIAAIEENAALNQVAVQVRSDDVIGRDEGWDTVLVGDVFYQAELSRQVMAWLQKLHARGAEVRIGDPGRSFLPMDLLECVATFAVVPVPAWDSVVDRPARVWRLRR